MPGPSAISWTPDAEASEWRNRPCILLVSFSFLVCKVAQLLNTIRVQVSSDFVLLRAGLRALLAESLNPDLIGESNAGTDTVVCARQIHPDILLLDVPHNDPDAFQVIRELKAELPNTHIIALSETEDNQLALRLLRAGVTGYLSHRETYAELTCAIETVARGDVFLCPSASSALLIEYRERGRAR